ncbi:MAG: CdaR family protein [Lawsonibacter sp.]
MDNIQMVNVPDGYQVTLATQVRTVKVRGKQEDLDKIDASQLSIVADLSDVDYRAVLRARVQRRSISMRTARWASSAIIPLWSTSAGEPANPAILEANHGSKRNRKKT